MDVEAEWNERKVSAIKTHSALFLLVSGSEKLATADVEALCALMWRCVLLLLLMCRRPLCMLTSRCRSGGGENSWVSAKKENSSPHWDSFTTMICGGNEKCFYEARFVIIFLITAASWRKATGNKSFFAHEIISQLKREKPGRECFLLSWARNGASRWPWDFTRQNDSSVES